MNAKTRMDGAPDVIYLQDLLDDWLGAGVARVILPITDPYVVHHGALGSFATVYLPADTDARRWLRASPACAASSRCCTRAEAAARFELPADRIGDLVVVSERFDGDRHRRRAARPVGARCAAALARRRLRAARAADRQPADRRPRPAARRWRNFDAFDLALNRRAMMAMRIERTVCASPARRSAPIAAATASSTSSTRTPGNRIGTVPKATLDEVRRAFADRARLPRATVALRARQHPEPGRGAGARAHARRSPR